MMASHVHVPYAYIHIPNIFSFSQADLPVGNWNFPGGVGSIFSGLIRSAYPEKNILYSISKKLPRMEFGE